MRRGVVFRATFLLRFTGDKGWHIAIVKDSVSHAV